MDSQKKVLNVKTACLTCLKLHMEAQSAPTALQLSKNLNYTVNVHVLCIMMLYLYVTVYPGSSWKQVIYFSSVLNLDSTMLLT